jgi:hypothetical protein
MQCFKLIQLLILGGLSFNRARCGYYERCNVARKEAPLVVASDEQCRLFGSSASESDGGFAVADSLFRFHFWRLISAMHMFEMYTFTDRTVR